MTLTVLNVAYPFAPVGLATVGGAEQVLSSLDRYLHEHGHRSLVLACAGSTAWGELHTVPLPEGELSVSARADACLRYRAQLMALLERERVDVVHLHGVDFMDYLPPGLAPTLVTLHLPLSFYALDALRALPSHVRLCCVSAAQRRDAPPDLQLLPDMENGVPLDLLRPSAEQEGYLLVMSRICPEKGIHLALDAARELDLPAVIAGRVYPYAEHQRYFEREIVPRLDQQRRFIGAVELPDKARWLARARALVVPSLVDETSSLVSMEALACGTPVVALRRGALPYVVEHGETGYVVDSYRELVSALGELSQIDRARCRRAAEQRFDERAMGARYLALYRELHAGHAAAPRRTHDELELAEIRSATELTALAPEWRALWERCPDATMFQRPEWLLPYARELLSGALCVLALRKRGELVSLCPFFTWQRDDGAVLSLLGAGVSDYQDVLIDPTLRDECRAALSRWLREAKVVACAFSELVPRSLLLELSCERLVGSQLEPQEVCPALVLSTPHEPLEPHLTKKLRAGLRAARRQSEEAGFTIERAETARLSEMLAALMELHDARRRALGETSCFATPEQRRFHEAVVQALSASGLLRMYGLYDAERSLVGVVYAVQERTALRIYQHGFDPTLARYSPGSLLMAHAIECAIDEGVTVHDFLRGDESYKYRWGALDRLRLSRRTLRLQPSQCPTSA